jgi:glutamyl/glutaminyl-tRNA synthetase
MRKILGVFLILLFLFGCLGFKTQAECDGINLKTGELYRDSERIACYHQAALSLAYQEKAYDAWEVCEDIVREIGSSHTGDNIGKKAETERNLCLFDIAKIIARDPDGGAATAYEICKDIEQEDYETQLKGAEATQKLCINSTAKIANIRPKKYYTKDENICSIVFIIPMLLSAAFIYRKKK